MSSYTEFVMGKIRQLADFGRMLKYVIHLKCLQSETFQNLQTKKKVKSGVTTYNKNKKALVIKKMLVSDFGNYMTGNKKKSRYVQQLVSLGK